MAAITILNVTTKAMGSGNSFKLRYILVKMYRKNQYILTGTFGYIFGKSQKAESWPILVRSWIFWYIFWWNLCHFWSNFGHFVVFLLSNFDRYRQFSKIPVYFQHLSKFLIILVVLVRILQKPKAKKRQLSFGWLLDDFWTSTMSDFWFSRNTKIFRQTHE